MGLRIGAQVRPEAAAFAHFLGFGTYRGSMNAISC